MGPDKQREQAEDAGMTDSTTKGRTFTRQRLARKKPHDVASAVGKLLQGVVSPIHQGVAPLGVLDVAIGLLGLVTVDVADDPPHVVDVLVGVVGLFLSEN